MKRTPTYEELSAENALMKAEIKAMQIRIAYLSRMLYGSKSDKLVIKNTDNQPGLFDEFFKEALDEKTAQIEETVKGIEAEPPKRRARAKKKNFSSI